LEGPEVRVHVLLGRHKPRITAGFLVSSLLISHGVRSDATAVFQYADKYVLVDGSRVRHLRPDQDSAEGYVNAVLHGKAGYLGATITDSLPLEEPCLNITPRTGVDVFTLDLRRYKSFIYGGSLRECETGFIGSDLPVHVLPAVVNILIDRIQAS
jgi:hypothetical protein